jgi:DNA-binding response OmpR family regulator
VPGELPTSTDQTATQTKPKRAMRVLVVDADRKLSKSLEGCDWQGKMQLTQVDSLAAARRHLRKILPDLIVVDSDLPDGSGIELTQFVAEHDSPVQTIVVSENADFDIAIQAMRNGAADFLVKPVKPNILKERVHAAMLRHRDNRKHRKELQRLRRVCKKLNGARKQVTQQVDVLCQDLVTAYQELASQMQQVVQSSEYAGIIRNELDLEALLRKTLEYILEKAGATNAAIFLPTGENEYALGGYVNYDRTSGSPEVLLQHLADIVAPKVADRAKLLHVTDNESIEQWIGSDYTYLADCHVLTSPCIDGEESLAVIMLFRDGGQPYSTDAVETIGAIAPMLGEYLNKVIRVHHRCAFDDEADTGDNLSAGDDDPDTIPF